MKRRATICLVVLLSPACVKIPVEAIKLNQLVRTNLQDLHSKHTALVHEYFRLKLESFDEWYLHSYEPKYKENYKKIWDKQFPTDPFDANKDAHRRAYLQNSIAKYEDFVTRIRGLEGDLTKKIEADYKDMIAANDGVGRLLESAKSVSDSQKELWNSTAGKLVPQLNAAEIDKQIKAIQDAAFKAM